MANSSSHPEKKPVSAIIILDGWGYREEKENNAIAAGNTPNFNQLWQEYPHTLLEASSSFVGLPDGQMGNSEVGHMNIGAGRIIYQDLTRIDQSIRDTEFEKNPVLLQAIHDATKTNNAIHIMGLLSTGGVHSHEKHFLAMLDLACQNQAKNIYVHAFLDGRDTPPKSAKESLQRVDEKLKNSGKGFIASIIGRYYAMDRDQNWDRVSSAYALLTSGVANYTAQDAISGLEAAYARGEKDEFVQATSIMQEGAQPITVQEGDTVIFMNYRADRARHLSECFTNETFNQFDRANHPQLAHFVTLTQYSATMNAECAYPPVHINNSLGEVMAQQGKTQLRLAETEKYAHVTFFLNGGREQPFTGEDRCLVKSPAVATYDLQPEMNAKEVTNRFVEAIESGKYDLIVCNFANTDMVGHTGNFNATVKAVETVDTAIGRITTALKKVNGQCLITADHGNAEQMVNTITGQAHTAHTSEPVPLLYMGDKAFTFKDSGRLCDLAPTILALMGIEQPEEMSGESLIKQ